VGGDGLEERGFDIGGHAFGVPADVEVRALVEPAPELGGVFADALLDVDFFLLIAGEGEVETLEGAVGAPGKELVTIEKVLGFALIAEEEPHGPASAAGLLVLEEGAEGRDAGAGADHDNGHIGRGGQAEELVGVDEEGELAAGRGALADVGRADALAGAAVAFVLDDADGEVDFVGVEGLTGGDGVEARGEAREKLEKLLRIVEFGRRVLEEVDELAAPEIRFEFLLVAGLDERGEVGVAGVFGPAFEGELESLPIMSQEVRASRRVRGLP